MVRTVVVVSVPALLLATASAAPLPKPKKGLTYYHPTVVGDTCEYGEFDKAVVTAVEKWGDGLTVTVKHTVTAPGRPAPPQTRVHTRWVSETSITELGNSVSTPTNFEKPFYLFKRPLGPEDGWDDAFGKWVPRGPEEVVVKAGKFLAIPAERIFGDPGKPTRDIKWYAPSVGLVREVRTVGGVVKHVCELTKFTRGDGTLPTGER